MLVENEPYFKNLVDEIRVSRILGVHVFCHPSPACFIR
jgi:hypothetical protein